MSFKNNFCKELYLDTISNRTHRVWYTKIRISNHIFAVETGRFSKPPGTKDFVYFLKKKNKKKKKKKQKSAVEDEKHVLVYCPWYGSLRKELYNSINDLCQNLKDLRTMIFFFNYRLNSDGPVVKMVARFVYLESLIHSSINVNWNIYACTLSVCLSVCLTLL